MMDSFLGSASVIFLDNLVLKIKRCIAVVVLGRQVSIAIDSDFKLLKNNVRSRKNIVIEKCS